jgi:hypothetical protein
LTGIPASGLGSISSAASSGTFVLLAKYDNGRGGTAWDSSPVWGPRAATGPQVGDVGGYLDYCNGGVMIQTSTNKTGCLWIASLCDTVAGQDYGTDTVNHVSYGGHNTCPHGQVDPYFQSTGPIVKSLVPYAWMQTFAELADVATGTKTVGQLNTPTLKLLHDFSDVELVITSNGGKTGAIWFDEGTDRLFFLEANRDRTTVPGVQFPIIHCWRLT